MCPTKDFQNKVQKSYVLFGFFVSVTLGLKIEKTHQLCAKLQGSVIIHYTGLTCLIISIFLPILNTHFCAKSQNGNFDGFYYSREFFLANYHMQYANPLLLTPKLLFLQGDRDQTVTFQSFTFRSKMRSKRPRANQRKTHQIIKLKRQVTLSTRCNVFLTREGVA